MRARGWHEEREDTAGSRLARAVGEACGARTGPKPTWFQSAVQIRRVRVVGLYFPVH